MLVDKPLQWTSFDVIRKIRRLVRIKKVGHAGTLDPLATGLLIVCTGKFTKRINEYMAREKEYTGTFTLGATTPTFDLESGPENFSDYTQISYDQIHAATSRFMGETMQLPPIHSAIKQGGKRVYEMARKGIDVQMEPRKIVVREFEVTHITLPLVAFRVVCSTGTYIRSLANDFGAYLGCGGYLSSLRRTRIGEFGVDDALTISEWEVQIEQEQTQLKGIADA